MLVINGTEWSDYVHIVEFEQKFEKLSSDKSGRTQSGDMFIDMIGTFYNYTLTLKRKNNCSISRWNDLWSVLSSPEPFLNLTLPYDTNGYSTASFKAYITSGSRKLIRRTNNTNYWGNVTLEFIAKSPQRRA